MGCGCVFLDDADRNDCGCDGPCCTEEWDVDTECLWRPELDERYRDTTVLLAAVRERDNTIAELRAELKRTSESNEAWATRAKSAEPSRRFVEHVHELLERWDNGEYDDMNQFSPHHFVMHLRDALDSQEEHR